MLIIKWQIWLLKTEIFIPSMRLRPKAEAVAVIGGHIVDVGENAAIESWIGEHTEVIDLQGKTMTPGLIEGHGTLSGHGSIQIKS